MTIGGALPGANAADAAGSPPVVPAAPHATTTGAAAGDSDDSGTHVDPPGALYGKARMALMADELFHRALFTLHQSAMPKQEAEICGSIFM